MVRHVAEQGRIFLLLSVPPQTPSVKHNLALVHLPRGKCGKWGHSSFLSLFAGFLTGFYGNMVLCQEPPELASEGFATTF